MFNLIILYIAGGIYFLFELTDASLELVGDERANFEILAPIAHILSPKVIAIFRVFLSETSKVNYIGDFIVLFPQVNVHFKQG